MSTCVQAHLLPASIHITLFGVAGLKILGVTNVPLPRARRHRFFPSVYALAETLRHLRTLPSEDVSSAPWTRRSLLDPGPNVHWHHELLQVAYIHYVSVTCLPLSRRRCGWGRVTYVT